MNPRSPENLCIACSRYIDQAAGRPAERKVIIERIMRSLAQKQPAEVKAHQQCAEVTDEAIAKTIDMMKAVKIAA